MRQDRVQGSLSQDSREMTRVKGKRGKGGEKGLRKGERRSHKNGEPSECWAAEMVWARR